MCSRCQAVDNLLITCRQAVDKLRTAISRLKSSAPIVHTQPPSYRTIVEAAKLPIGSVGKGRLVLLDKRADNIAAIESEARLLLFHLCQHERHPVHAAGGM